MPYVQIPPDRLEHLPLFGYDLVFVEGDRLWYHGPFGRTAIDRNRPYVWVDDIGEAIQLGAIAIAQIEGAPEKIDRENR
jgi:hypothetical protein